MSEIPPLESTLVELQLQLLSNWNCDDPQLQLDIRVLRHAISQNLSQTERINIVNRIIKRQEQLLRRTLASVLEQVHGNTND